jgi:hypothetical protein
METSELRHFEFEPNKGQPLSAWLADRWMEGWVPHRHAAIPVRTGRDRGVIVFLMRPVHQDGLVEA